MSNNNNQNVSSMLHYQENESDGSAIGPQTPVRKVATRPRILRPRPLKLSENCLSTCATTPERIDLFCTGNKPRVDAFAYARNENKPAANVNPFTPEGILLSKKRKRCDTLFLNSPELITSDVNLDSDMKIEQSVRKITLEESNIARYDKEFHPLKLVGRGCFGTVYKCLNRLDGCIYAIKKSHQPIAGKRLENKALNEIYAHAVLENHPHVVRYFSAWAENNHVLIQSEYCNGGSLEEKISKNSLSGSELCRLIQHIAKGLEHIHSAGLVHLDIKPENILISHEKIKYTNYDSTKDCIQDLDDSSVFDKEHVLYKIGDFGHITSLITPNVDHGDCRYIPKELLRDDFTHLTQADVFSFGLTVVEAAGSGPLPKYGKKWHKLREGRLPPLAQTLSPGLLELITSMINPDPTLRPSLLQILQHPAICRVSKTAIELNRELEEEKLKNKILSKQLVRVANCMKTLVLNSELEMLQE